MNRRMFVVNGIAGFTSLVALSPMEAKAFAAPAQSAAPVMPTWLRRFDDQPVSTLLRRQKFRLLMETCFAGMTAPFWSNYPILCTVRAYMSKPDFASVDHNRYFVAKGSMAHFGRSRAMLWIDTYSGQSQSAPPRAVLSVIDTAQSGRALWIIANSPLLDGSPTSLPVNFRLNLSRWIRSRRPLRWEGGLFQDFYVHDTSPVKHTPVATSFGVPSFRCAPAMQSKAV